VSNFNYIFVKGHHLLLNLKLEVIIMYSLYR